MFYALANDEEFWSSRINGMIALAPVTRIDNTRSLIFKYVAGLGKAFKTTLDSVGMYNFFVSPGSTDASSFTCRVMPGLCVFTESIVISDVPSNTIQDKDRFQVYMGHFPAGASTQNFHHFA